MGTPNSYVSDHLRVCRLTLDVLTHFCRTVKEIAIYYSLFPELAALSQAVLFFIL